jgi:predicted ATPase
MRDSVVEYLSPKAMLLVLDNCEHLIDPAAELINLVRTKCPGVRVLATSREPLAVDGERVFPLRSLSVPVEGDEGDSEAVRLFVERARSARPEFALTPANAAVVGEVCRRLDGIALAVELAAARVTSMSPAEISAHLDERFRLLAGRRRGSVERHQTLRATLDWSYSLLGETERMVFDRLGVFAGSFDADAATAVAGEDLDSWDVLDTLDSLAAKSMLLADTTDQGATRYRMLETMRHYARERLADQGDPDRWRSRHADYYARLSRAIGEALQGPEEIPWRRRLTAELDDLRAAVNWSLDRPGDARCVTIVAALSVQAAQVETAGIGTWAERCVERAQDAPAALRAAVLGAAAWESERRRDPQACALGQDALRDGLPVGWPASYLPHMALAQAWATQGRLDKALEVAASGHTALDAAGAPRVGHTALLCLEATFTPDPEMTRQLADAALANAQACDNPTGLAIGWYTVGYANLRHDPARSAAALDQSAAMTRAGAGDGVYAYALICSAVLESATGDAETALASLEEAVRYGRDSGNQLAIDTAAGFGLMIMANLGEPGVAATLSGAHAEAVMWMMQANGYGAEYQDTIARLRRQLDRPALDAAVATGVTMSHEQIAAFLLHELARLRSSLAVP